VLAKPAHAFAKLFSATDGATTRDVPTEAFASAPCRFSGAAKGAANAVPAPPWAVATHAPVLSSWRPIEHTRAFVSLILQNMFVGSCHE
jgi:hypothetical protein